MWHIADQPLVDGFWLDCFTHERKHQCTKDCAQSIENTTAFEKSVLTTVINCTVEHLKTTRPSSLAPQSAANPELSAALGVPVRVANYMRYESIDIAAADVLFVDSCAVKVEACLHYGDTFAVLATQLDLLDRPSSTTSLWRPGPRGILELDAAGLRHPACWHEKSDGVICALGL